MALSTELVELGYRAVRVYTMALRFPRMVGKGFNGERLPGGPYTVHQFIGGGLIFGLSGISAYYTPVINPIVNLLAGAGLALVIGNLLATIPVDGIPILTRISWVAGLLASTAPSTSELMPTTSPVTVVGGDVAVLAPPRVQTSRPQRHHGDIRRPRRPQPVPEPGPQVLDHPSGSTRRSSNPGPGSRSPRRGARPPLPRRAMPPRCSGRSWPRRQTPRPAAWRLATPPLCNPGQPRAAQ